MQAKYTVIYGNGGKQPCHTKADIGHFITHLLEGKPEGGWVSVSVCRNKAAKRPRNP